jgi:hypothetical protein
MIGRFSRRLNARVMPAEGAPEPIGPPKRTLQTPPRTSGVPRPSVHPQGDRLHRLRNSEVRVIRNLAPLTHTRQRAVLSVFIGQPCRSGNSRFCGKKWPKTQQKISGRLTSDDVIREAASIQLLWSGIRGKTLAATADIRDPRTSTTAAARSARSASAACASGRPTASSGGWPRSCCGDRGPEPATGFGSAHRPARLRRASTAPKRSLARWSWQNTRGGSFGSSGARRECKTVARSRGGRAV